MPLTFPGSFPVPAGGRGAAEEDQEGDLPSFTKLALECLLSSLVALRASLQQAWWCRRWPGPRATVRHLIKPVLQL